MPMSLTPGSRAPDFTLPADGNSTVRLSDHMGRKVVLFFYPRDDTSGCTREAKDFTELKPQFDTAEADIIGISADPISSHDKFKAKHQLEVALASDTDQSVLKNYGVWVEKSMYGRTYMGIERTTILIDRSGRISQIWRKVKVAGHAQQVLSSAQELD